MSDTISLSKVEYTRLSSRAKAYDLIVSLVQKEIDFVAPVRSTKKIISELKKTGKYSENFLKSVERGFGRSSNFVK